MSWWRLKQPKEPIGDAPWAPALSGPSKGFSETGFSPEWLGQPPVNVTFIPPATLESVQDKMTQPFPSVGPQGHRSRMREKLLSRGPDSLADYELLEMLLFFAMPKGDTKPLAKTLINRFGSFAAVLTAPQKDLLAVHGLAEFGLTALKLVQASALRLVKAELVDRPILDNWNRLIEYLTAVLARERIEQFRVLFLDTKNRLLCDELLGRGTFNHTPVYPREILKRALELNAGAIILVHNHPSGDPSPSDEDIDVTRDIKAATSVLQITLHDHVIVGNGRCFSLRSNGLL